MELGQEFSLQAPALVVAPEWRVRQWERVLRGWASPCNCVCYVGDEKNRAAVREWDWEPGTDAVDVLLCTPDVLQEDIDMLSEQRYAAF